MVKNRSLLVALSVTFVLMSFVGAAAQREYHLEHEWVKIWINPEDGSIDLLYDISITLDSGPDINFVNIGQPQRDFTIGMAMDQYGRTLVATDSSSGSDYKVRVNVHEPLRAGQTVRLNLTTNVAQMIYEDTQNPDNVGMEFIPTWWEEANVLDLRVLIVLPSGVTSGEVKTSVDWDNALTEDGQLAIYWERKNLSPNQRYTFGASFPKEYVQAYETKPTGVVALLQQYGPALLIFGVFIVAIGIVVYVRKRPYQKPKVSIETLGIRHGLTAVEASYLLDVKPTKIVTKILYSLLLKRAIWVESTTPILKLKMLKPFQNKIGPKESPLRYYEIDFLNTIKEDGVLDEEKLAQAIVFIRNTVEEKMRGYCRRDTIDYYRKIVEKAWGQVEQAGTPELASKAYDEQLLWLFLDPKYKSRTQTTFRSKAFEPSPFWLWYWYSYRYYNPKPSYKPNIEAPTKAAKPPTIPGADFANNIATAVENTSNNIVTNIEKFANTIAMVPAKRASTRAPQHRASCVCACAACACVCACVSCACACASGGVG